ncbi:MAG: hypothetical protein WDW38_009635 [Sanguina aurantia]
MRHLLPDGYGVEVLRRVPAAHSSLDGAAVHPPLLFVHGSYHAAWCWAEHFMPFFADRGYACYAVSMRCQGNSDQVADVSVAGTLDSHARDLADLIELLPSPPIVISHSFGGLIMQKYILSMAASGDAASSSSGSSISSSISSPIAGTYPRLAGAAFLCSCPPTGNSSIVSRYLKSDLVLSFKVTWGFVTRSFARNVDACREMFFSSDLPDEDVRRYQQLLAASSLVRLIDLNDTNKQVPLAPPPPHMPPVFVMGSADDIVVDIPAVKELAQYYGCEPVVLPRLAHDCMLDTRWETAAAAIVAFLDAVPAPAAPPSE